MEKEIIQNLKIINDCAELVQDYHEKITKNEE